MQRLVDGFVAWAKGTSRKAWLVYAGSLVALVLYALGIKFLVVPYMVLVGALYLPLPRIFTSMVSRIVVSFLLSFALLQIALSLQFLIFHGRGFVVLAAFTILLHIGMWMLYADFSKRRPSTAISRNDLAGLVVALCFVVPFAPIIAGQDSVVKIAKIGGIQAIDGTNHYASIAEMTEAQHLNYAPGYYYPKTFHLAEGFVENTVIARHTSLSWRANAELYFAQYIYFGALLAFVLYYLCIAWLARLTGKVTGGLQILAALALGMPLALFYLIPFVVEGFFNYYYVCATIACGAIFLTELACGSKGKEVLVEITSGRSKDIPFYLLGFFVLIYGASGSWPLLIPPIVCSALIIALPNKAKLDTWRRIVSLRAAPIVLMCLFQLVPIYFQLKYSIGDSTQGINLTGGLREFHPLFLLAGVVLVGGFAWSGKAGNGLKAAVTAIFMPFLAFIGILVAYQYFTVGEIRYYVIKSALAVEMLLLCFGVALMVATYAKSTVRGWKQGIFVAAVPLLVLLTLVSVVANPLKDDRDLFRTTSGEEKPQYFDQDVGLYTQLSSTGVITHFNSTLLHYSQDKGKLFAHPQIPFWQNMMQYSGKTADFYALHCEGRLYGNLGFGTFTDAEQTKLIQDIFYCAKMANDNGVQYYIVTDGGSVPHLKTIFGNAVKLVY